MARKSKEEITAELKERGYKYLGGEYKNLSSQLEVECKKGHEFYSSLNAIRKDSTCPICEMYSQIDMEEAQVDTPPKKKAKRTLALDNATKITGYAIFEGDELVSAGVKKVPESANSAERIALMKQWMIGIIRAWEIDAVGLEDVYYSGNPQTLILLSKLLGVLENAAFELTSKVYVVPAGTWRNHCKIKGRSRAARKEGAQRYVKQNYGVVASQDKADAICIGSYVLGKERFGEIVEW